MSGVLGMLLGSTGASSANLPNAPTNVVSEPFSLGYAVVSYTQSTSNGGSPITSYTCTTNPAYSTATVGPGSTFLITVQQGGLYTFSVYATNANGNGPASLPSAERRFPTLPINTVLPVITGTTTRGSVLTVSNGTWTGYTTDGSSMTFTYSYQWQRNSVDISGATANTYTLGSADGSTTIRCNVTANDAAVAGRSTTVSTNGVSIPVLIPDPPTIGTAVLVGSTSANVPYTAPAANGGATITSYTARSTPGSITATLSQAGSGTITVNGLSVNTSYTFIVFATNSAGNSPDSGASNQITTLTPPVNSVAPTISGTGQYRTTLTVTNTGTWSNSPTGYSYQWQRNGSNLLGYTSSSYTILDPGDRGTTIRCVVTASNAAGSGSANSNGISITSGTPDAPTIGTATATSGTSATVSYTAPGDNGGATITSYTAVSNPGSITGTLSTSTDGTITVNGLSPNTNYTFTVYATNSIGNSANSSSSNQITTPADNIVTATSISIFGGGGGGGSSPRGGGGGGGGFVLLTSQSLTKDTNYQFTIGAGGASNQNGGSSTWNGTSASGGNRGNTGVASGTGGSGGSSGGGYGGGSGGVSSGGGGGGGGTNGGGNNGASSSTGTGGSGGTGGYDSNSGNFYGGGGGGGSATSGRGGAGGSYGGGAGAGGTNVTGTAASSVAAGGGGASGGTTGQGGSGFRGGIYLRLSASANYQILNSSLGVVTSGTSSSIDLTSTGYVNYYLKFPS